MYRPTGSVVQLMDGRIFKRNQRNLWGDLNSGVTITEQQLSVMMTAMNFSSDASGGGRTNRPVRFVPDYTATQIEWADINSNTSDIEILNTNQIISGINAPIQIRLSFSSTSYAATSFLKVYKNDTVIDTISTNTRPTKSGDGPGFYTLSETFSTGNTLKFGAGGNQPVNYTVIVQNKTDNNTNISLTPFSVDITEFGL